MMDTCRHINATNTPVCRPLCLGSMLAVYVRFRLNTTCGLCRQACASRPEAEANLDACVREEQHAAMAVDTLTSGNPFAHQPWTLKPTGRSMFGHQTDSRKSSLPQYSFVGGTNRDQARGVFVSPGHLEVSLQCKQKAQ